MRLAHRMLARALERVAPPADAFVLAEDGRFFVPPFGTRVVLDTRESLRRVLAALAIEWRDRRGASLGVPALFAAGWPGERALPAAAKNRVRVALATLRQLGLRGVVATTADGYRLRPDARVVVLPAV